MFTFVSYRQYVFRIALYVSYRFFSVSTQPLYTLADPEKGGVHLAHPNSPEPMIVLPITLNFLNFK